MKAQEAYDALTPDAWSQTSIADKLDLLRQVQRNLVTYAEELGRADGHTKNGRLGADIFGHGYNINSTVGPIATAVSASVDLYESLARGRMLTAKAATEIAPGRYDLEVFPLGTKDRITAGSQRGHLRVIGTPRQVSPQSKPAGVIAILGAGNYSSSLEMIKAMFWENKAVIHKPHHLNEDSDAIWQKVFAPLVAVGALSFCDANQGRILTTLEGLTAIYFTGGTDSARAIMEATTTPLVAECGGNNPCIVVPGVRPWTDAEIEHQAVQFVTLAKLNGGAVCGRAQTLVTSANWPQREQFLEAVRTAFTEGTPAVGTYYPGSEETRERFLAAYPDAEALASEGGAYPHTEALFITGASEDSFAAQNEAFCLINSEIALDVSADPAEFLPAAVEFCNTKLLGSLAAMVIIDEDTRSQHQAALDAAVDDLAYGAIAVNTIPGLVFANASLTWGGHDPDGEFVSGNGNFGNLLCYENVEKSVLYDRFVSPTHFLFNKKQPFDRLMEANAIYSAMPTWINLTRLMATSVRAGLARKDF